MNRPQTATSRADGQPFTLSFFNRANDATPKPESLTWSAFVEHCRTPAIRSVKDGALFSPATFGEIRNEKGSLRHSDNVQSVSMLALDYDHDADFDIDIRVWRERGLKFFAYTSHSHLRKTDTNPKAEQRFRVVLPLVVPIPATNYLQLWKWAAEQSNGKIDAAPKALAQMFYLPAKSSASATYKFEEHKGALLDWRTLGLKEESQSAKAKQQPSSVEASTFNFDEMAEPPAKKLEGMLEHVDGFAGVWNRASKFKDEQGASKAELSLFSYAVQSSLKWEDHELVNLGIAFRRLHKIKQKWLKTTYTNAQKYYRNTIVIARTPSTKPHIKTQPTNERIARLGIASSNEKTEQITEEPVIENFTDVGNAKRLKRLFGQDLRYSKKLKDWFVWDGKRWNDDEELKVNGMAQATARAIYDEIKIASSDDQRKAIAKHAIASESSTKQRGLLTEARSMLAVRLDTFDAHTYLLNCANGTLDLQTSEWHSHTREHYLTRLAPVDFDASAKCPTWLKFLERIFNSDEEMVAFIQRAIGCTLVGESQKREMFILHGKGSNGKSTLLATMKAMLGDYAATTAVETLMQTKFNNNSADLATLRGSRFVMASESNESQRLNTTLIKKLLGGDTQKVRNLYQSHFEYVPEFRLWFATNYKPMIDANDEAAWDRVYLIPFDVRIPEREQDKQLLDKLRAELSGILAWAIEGCFAYLQSGLEAPAKVKAATKEYRAENDLIGDFIEEKCVCDEGYIISSTELYQVMAGWLANNGEQEMSQKKFVQELQKRGMTTVREAGTGKKVLRGITLRYAVEIEAEQGREDRYKKKREYMEREERNKKLAERD
jgi:putative DNA primase/helicase